MNRRLPFAPVEGWLTLGLVGLMCITMALALDDARWVLGRDQYLDCLMYVAIGGVLAGFVGPKVGWGRWTTYLVGAIFAALIVPIVVAEVAFPKGGASIHDLYDATAASVVTAYIDIAIRNYATTSQYLHHILIFALLVWGTSMFASYAVFGHHRPLNAVVVVGVILVGNMSITTNDEMSLLITFTVASLLLLIRSHVFDEQSEWLRRRIGDPATISSVYLRGGTIFIVIAVALSVLLTQTASSAPLAGAWGGLQDGLIGLSRTVSRFLPTGGSSRSLGLSFGPDAPVGQLWTTSDATAVTIQHSPTDNGKYYWRGYVYDEIDFKGFRRTDATAVSIAPDARLLDQTADDVGPIGRQSVTFTVTPVEFNESTILAPETPIGVDESVRRTTIGTSGYFATLDRGTGSGVYSVTALTLVLGSSPGQLNQTDLRAAGQAYPDEVKRLYLTKQPGVIGSHTLDLEHTIEARAGSTNPFDLATAAVHVLQADPYQYSTDIRDLPCEGLSDVECFATYKKGFCQYYAAAMAMVLRDLGIPTRIAEGFLPGARDANSAIERIPYSNAHAWVEVYFPGYGWVTFDPTGGDRSQIAPIPSGPPAASASARSSGGPLPTIPRKPDIGGGASGSGGSSTTPSRPLGPLLAVGLLLLLVVVLLGVIAWRRGPRGPTSAEGAYGTVVRIASRFGFGPRPAQTVYEYASSLGDVLPTVRPELETVAKAKVESIYAREILGQERLDVLRAAQRRLRVGLLRLAFRRKQRRKH